MKLYIYQGLKNEKAPKDVTHVFVDSNVTVIKQMTFYHCSHLVSVIMGDNVKRIEGSAFHRCCALRKNQLVKIFWFYLRFLPRQSGRQRDHDDVYVSSRI